MGCGTPDAGDDAVGLLIADPLRGRLPQGVEIRTDTAGGVNLLHWCEGVEVLILVDAALATNDFPAGQWRRFVFPADRHCLKTMALCGTHVLGLVQALELAEVVGCLPGEVLLFALAGSQFELGVGLSPAVRASLAEVLDALEAEVKRRLRTPA